jgi:hypothetical protein
MRFFSFNYYADHYNEYLLGGHSYTFVGGKTATDFNSKVNALFNEGFCRANRIFVFKSTAGSYNSKTTGTAAFRNDYLRFGLVATSTFQVKPGDALDGQTVQCGLWTGKDLVLDAGTSLTMAAPALTGFNQFGSTTALVVNGDINPNITGNLTINVPVRVSYSGTLMPPLAGGPPYYNYMPVDLSSTSFPMAPMDLSFHQVHCATGTTIAGTTVIIRKDDIRINRPGFGVETYVANGAPVTFFDSSAGPLYVQKGVPPNTGMKVTIVAQNSIIVSGDLTYDNPPSPPPAASALANALRSFAVIAGGDLSFGHAGVPLTGDVVVSGYFYSGGKVAIYTNSAAPLTVTLSGALTLAGPVDTFAGDVGQRIRVYNAGAGTGKLNILYDPMLRSNAPEFLPEKPVLVRLQAVTK